jgi:hypothetical protein
MKKLTLLFLALIIALPFVSLKAEEEKEAKRSTWIERIFGTREEREAAAEARKEAREEAEKATKEVETKKKDKGGKEFTEEERKVLESWQQGNASWKKKKKPLPPGLQKKVDRGGELPPGWKKKLEIGEKLDPEIAEQARPLPDEILKRFPKIEEGIKILEVGGEIIKVVEDSLEIIDILSRGSGDD